MKRPTTCICCQTQKIDLTNGTDLCNLCWEEAGMENEHNDGYHVQPDPFCHICQNFDPHEGKAAAGNLEGTGGQVGDPNADRRLAANRNLPKRTAKDRRLARKARKDS